MLEQLQGFLDPVDCVVLKAILIEFRNSGDKEHNVDVFESVYPLPTLIAHTTHVNEANGPVFELDLRFSNTCGLDAAAEYILHCGNVILLVDMLQFVEIAVLRAMFQCKFHEISI